MTTLSLEASKLVYELIGDYETEKHHLVPFEGKFGVNEPVDISEWEDYEIADWKERIPAPTFAELIRVLPRIWEVIKRPLAPIIVDLADKYMHAPSEPEGMKAVEDYLMKLLK